MGWKLGGHIADALGLDKNKVKKIEMSIEPNEPATVDVTQYVFSEDPDEEGRLQTALFHFKLVPADQFDALQRLVDAVDETKPQGVHQTHDIVMLRGYDWNRIVEALFAAQGKYQKSVEERKDG